MSFATRVSAAACTVHAFEVVNVQRPEEQVDGGSGRAQMHPSPLVEFPHERERPLVLHVRARGAVLAVAQHACLDQRV